jgi:membrane protein DedA with SNARE-associated domain
MDGSAFLNLVNQYGYVGLYLLVGVEAFEFVFSFPLSPLLVTLGHFSATGEFSYWGLWLAAWAGAMSGDIGGYFLGLKAGRPILLRLSRHWLKPEKLNKAEKFFEKYGVWAIFWGRFIFASLAAPINLLAGISKMRFAKFLVADIFGQAVWATIYLTLGYFLGPKVAGWLEGLARFGASIPVLLIIALALSIYLVYRKRKEKKQNQEKLK